MANVKHSLLHHLQAILYQLISLPFSWDCLAPRIVDSLCIGFGHEGRDDSRAKVGSWRRLIQVHIVVRLMECLVKVFELILRSWMICCKSNSSPPTSGGGGDSSDMLFEDN